VLRNWLTSNGLVCIHAKRTQPWLTILQKGKQDVEMTPEVVEKTRDRYLEVYKLLTGTSMVETLKSVQE
jgi:phosphoribosylaminoimidazole-succinocarboxamide synthase